MQRPGLTEKERPGLTEVQPAKGSMSKTRKVTLI